MNLIEVIGLISFVAVVISVILHFYTNKSKKKEYRFKSNSQCKNIDPELKKLGFKCTCDQCLVEAKGVKI